MSDGKESSEPSMESRKFSKRIAALADYSKSKIQSGAVDLTARVKDFRAKSAIDAVLEAPDRFKREWQKHGATGAITKFPIATIVVFLLLTAFFVSQSGFLDDTRFDDEPGEPALNVNGDLEVYLPEGSQVAELISLVEDDWSTNVMIIYVESGSRNITDKRILLEMSYVENQLNPYLSDSVNDDVIYILSLSTVIKEVNSSAPRVREAFLTELFELGCAQSGQEDVCQCILAAAVNDIMRETDDQFGGSYEIPVKPTIDLIIDQMYEEDDGRNLPFSLVSINLARDVCTTGERDCGGPDGQLDRAIMAVAVSDEVEAKGFDCKNSSTTDQFSKEESYCDDVMETVFQTQKRNMYMG